MTNATSDRFPTAGERLPEIIREVNHADDVEIPPDAIDAAQQLADVVGGEHVEWPLTSRGGGPGVVATSCIYVADYAVRGEGRVTQERLCELAPGSHPTVRKYYRDVPAVFFEHSTTSDRRHLDRIPIDYNGPDVSVLDVLRVFNAAERAGIGIRNIDLGAEPAAMRKLANALEEVQV
ncbi:hypothetical protein [Natrinema marinum]|uniref:hypothetical protein n=1 Tax=Natrinema marinum TaxID=2961598 RepID=UPI0020C8E7F7|nr:hypothetical protein [Natrinema marinum]